MQMQKQCERKRSEQSVSKHLAGVFSCGKQAQIVLTSLVSIVISLTGSNESAKLSLVDNIEELRCPHLFYQTEQKDFELLFDTLLK